MISRLELLVDIILSTLFVLGILVFFPVFFSLDMFDPIQNTLEEMQLTDVVFSHLRDYDKVDIDPNIVVINNGHLNRSQIAGLIDIINYHEPKVIGIDAMFRKPKGDEQDIPLENSLAEVNNLVMACDLRKGVEGDRLRWDSIALSRPEFLKNADIAYVNVYTPDGEHDAIRMNIPRSYVKDSVVNSFPVGVCEIFAPDKVKRFLARGNDYEVINYKRNQDKYTVYDYTDLFNDPELYTDLKDKIVLIGYLGPNLQTKVTEDIKFTPMNKNYVGKTEPDMYGVLVHANVISMIIEEDYISSTPEWLSTFLMLFFVVLNMYLLKYFRIKYPNFYQPFTIILVLGELIGFSFIIIFLMHWFNIELKFAGAFFAFIVCVLAFEVYNDSLKPLVVSQWRSYTFERDRKRAKKFDESRVDSVYINPDFKKSKEEE